MAQDVRFEQLNKLQSTDNSTAVSSSKSNSGASYIDFSNSKGSSDDVNINNKGSKNNNNIANSRSLNEVYKSVEAILKRYGISITDAKNAALLEKISDRKPEELVKMDNKELNNIVLCLTKALEKLSVNGKTPDINAVIKKANDYNIAIITGWSIEGFEKYNSKNSDSISKRLGRFLGKKNFDITKASPEERKQAIKAYFNGYFKNMKGKSHDYILKLQLQDFGKLLINSSEEEKVCFKEVINELSAEVKGTALEATFANILKIENKIAFANSWKAEDINELAGADRFGKLPSNEDTEHSVEIIYKHKDAGNLVKTHKDLNEGLNKFIEKNKEKIEKIETKIKNNEALTEEEQELYDEYQRLKAISTGEIVGTAENDVIQDELRNKILILINNDNYEQGENYYRDVLKKVSDYIEKHAKELGLSTDEYKNLLDKTTNGNYSTVVNDSNNGTTTKLNTQPSITEEEHLSLTEEKETSGYSSNNFYYLSEQKPNEEDINNKKEQIKDYEQSNLVETKSSDVTTKSNLLVRINEKGFANTLEFVLSSTATSGFVKSFFKNVYAQKRASEQIGVLKSLQNIASFCELLSVTKDETLLKIGGNEKFANVYMTKIAHEKYEDTAKKYEKNDEPLLA